MPSTIPYDPSLVMGPNAVEEADEDAVQQTENEGHDEKTASSDSGSCLIPRHDIFLT